MALDPKVQDLHESFFKPLQFFVNASMSALVSSRHTQSSRRVRLGHCHEIKTRASLPMLVDLRSHFNSSFVTESILENSDCVANKSSDWVFNKRR
ncbi:hypothetical protein Ahy_A09g042942 [Arachis hypogaea]|uniref:Uncharacterized protein n=1 Tax=Arachis hypogaea TaxID=3818 RepID=A0A445BH58_ARAHY|nr:hypothetical protein Ahy_A09g042942 [Arachis hypogaea]